MRKTVTESIRRGRYARVGLSISAGGLGRPGGGQVPGMTALGGAAPVGSFQLAGVVPTHTHDHGGLTGLGDDDHAQYAKAGASRAGTISVEANSAINQDLTTDSSTAQLASILLSDDLVYSKATGLFIRANTSEGSDTKIALLTGGGTQGSGRGGFLATAGNEYVANYYGTAWMYGGAPGTAGAYDGMLLFGPNYTLRWLMDRSGNLMPVGAGTLNIGDAANYIGDLSYKTLTDRGCLGWFENGVEMPDGSLVSDMEALRLIRVDPTKETVYGVPRLDYLSMPRAVYKPAPVATEDIYEPVGMPEEGKDPEMILRWRKGEKMGDDGAELTALISVMLGAVKEVDGRLAVAEAKLAKVVL